MVPYIWMEHRRSTSRGLCGFFLRVSWLNRSLGKYIWLQGVYRPAACHGIRCFSVLRLKNGCLSSARCGLEFCRSRSDRASNAYVYWRSKGECWVGWHGRLSYSRCSWLLTQNLWKVFSTLVTAASCSFGDLSACLLRLWSYECSFEIKSIFFRIQISLMKYPTLCRIYTEYKTQCQALLGLIVSQDEIHCSDLLSNESPIICLVWN